MSNEHSVLKFHIKYRSGSEARLEVDSGRARIGSAPYCELQLRGEGIAPLHVTVENTGPGLRATAHAAGVLLNNQPLESAAVAIGATIVVGGQRVVVEGCAGERARSSLLAWRWLALLLLVGVGARLATIAFGPAMSAQASQLAPSVHWPSLWGPLPSAHCEGESPASGRAAEHIAAAQQLAERLPFFPHAGVLAVERWQQAAACLERAGRLREAASAKRGAANLRARVEQQYRARQAGLSWALQRADWGAVRRQSQALLALLRRQPGPISQWLEKLERRANTLSPARLASSANDRKTSSK